MVTIPKKTKVPYVPTLDIIASIIISCLIGYQYKSIGIALCVFSILHTLDQILWTLLGRIVNINEGDK